MSVRATGDEFYLKFIYNFIYLYMLVARATNAV